MLGRQNTIPGSLPHVDFDDFASVSRRKEDIVGLSKGLLHGKRAGTRHLQVIKRELNLFGGGSAFLKKKRRKAKAKREQRRIEKKS